MMAKSAAALVVSGLCLLAGAIQIETDAIIRVAGNTEQQPLSHGND